HQSTLLPSLLPSSLHHPALHSFPTRRSSDLGHLRLTQSDDIIALGASSCLVIDEVIAIAVRDCGLADLVCPKNVAIHSHLASHEDRKSTRLNSSHLGISYAVFCLKKKIIKND